MALYEEIFNDLSKELENDKDYNEDLLSIKIKGAIREIKDMRCYPDFYTEEMILDDLDRLYSYIKNLARYDYNSIGGEGESQHQENGTNRTFVSRSKMFFGVVPISH